MKTRGEYTNIRTAMITTFYLSFFFMIMYYLVMDWANEIPVIILSLTYWGCMIAAFVLSIIHLVKYTEKGYAIVILVISSIINMIFGFAFMMGVIEAILGV